MCLIFLRPFNTVSFFGKIAESTPLEFTQRNRTTQLYFLIADTDYFPVALTRATFYIQSLSYTEWIWLKIDYFICFHGIIISQILSRYFNVDKFAKSRINSCIARLNTIHKIQ